MRATAFALALAALGAGAQAHPMPHSTVVVRAGAREVELVASIPVSELRAAMGEASAREAGAYVVRHAGVTGADGRGWRPVVRKVEPGEVDGHAVMSVRLGFTPPAGAATKPANLRYDAVTHRVASHYVLVYRRDGEALTPRGRLQSPTTELKLP